MCKQLTYDFSMGAGAGTLISICVWAGNFLHTHSEEAVCAKIAKCNNRALAAKKNDSVIRALAVKKGSNAKYTYS